MARHWPTEGHTYRVEVPHRDNGERLWPLLGGMALGAVIVFLIFCSPLI